MRLVFAGELILFECLAGRDDASVTLPQAVSIDAGGAHTLGVMTPAFLHTL